MDDEPTGAADEDAPADDEESAAVDGEPEARADIVSSRGVGQPDPSLVEVSDHRIPAEVVDEDGDAPMAEGESSAADEIIELPWDDDLPVALGEEIDSSGRDETVADGTPVDGAYDVQGDGDAGPADPGGDGDDDEVRPDEYFARRRRETRQGLESWRTRSATGAIASAIAMGLQQVFEPEKRRPAMVAEAPSDPYSDDDPVTVEYVPDDAEATTVRVKPWLLQKGDPA